MWYLIHRYIRKLRGLPPPLIVPWLDRPVTSWEEIAEPWLREVCDKKDLEEGLEKFKRRKK